MPSYKLSYFNTKGFGENARMLFKVAGVEFEDIRYSREEWPSLKEGKSLCLCFLYVLCMFTYFSCTCFSVINFNKLVLTSQNEHKVMLNKYVCKLVSTF